ncbi:MAG TPA: GatB/YqeY domain-containing protein [Tissierellales bacterium]|nr:GatB/YqeY domain-containing protein [Tissierellales bacterium]
MSLKNKLMEDFKTSMKNRDTIRKNTITMVRSSIKQKEVDEKIEVSDEEVLDIISKQVKERKNSIEEFKKGNREDLVELTRKEMDVLLEYLPEQLTEEEIEEIVKDIIEEVKANSMKDMGLVMQNVMPKVKGRADGSLVNKIVKKHLN